MLFINAAKLRNFFRLVFFLADFLIRLLGMPFLQKKCIPHGDALILTEMLSLTSPLT